MPTDTWSGKIQLSIVYNGPYISFQWERSCLRQVLMVTRKLQYSAGQL